MGLKIIQGSINIFDLRETSATRRFAVKPETMATAIVVGGRSLSEVHITAKRILLRARDGIERLKRFESASLVDSSDLTSSVKQDATEVQSLCSNMDSLWRSIDKSERDLWREGER